MTALKTGARLKSTVCDGEVMVVSVSGEGTIITCGGAPMVASNADAERVAIDPEQTVGMAIGKRYVTAAGDVELLCIKAGNGSLAANGNLLLRKDTKQLPKTD